MSEMWKHLTTASLSHYNQGFDFNLFTKNSFCKENMYDTYINAFHEQQVVLENGNKNTLMMICRSMYTSTLFHNKRQLHVLIFIYFQQYF